MASTQRVLLRPKTGWQPVDLGELWHYRELLWILALRDIKVRYKQTALGAAWAIIQPFFTMIIFTVIFAGYGKLPTDGVPAPLFYFCGLLPWQLFSNSLTNAGNSLIGNQNLITKVYFPRLAIPMSGVVEGFPWCMLGRAAPGPLLAVSAAMIVVLLIGGLLYFRRMGKTFADRV